MEIYMSFISPKESIEINNALLLVIKQVLLAIKATPNKGYINLLFRPYGGKSLIDINYELKESLSDQIPEKVANITNLDIKGVNMLKLLECFCLELEKLLAVSPYEKSIEIKHALSGDYYRCHINIDNS